MNMTPVTPAHYCRLVMCNRGRIDVILYIPVIGEHHTPRTNENEILALEPTDADETRFVPLIPEESGGEPLTWDKLYKALSEKRHPFTRLALPEQKPMFNHSCKSCVYVGSNDTYDIYLCPQTPCGEITWAYTLLWRYGPQPHEYASMDVYPDMHKRNPDRWQKHFATCSANGVIHRRAREIQSNLGTHE